MKKTMLFCLMSFLAGHVAWSQQVTISGRVSSANDAEKVQKATVMVKGSTRATQTDENGMFRLMVPSLPVTLIVTNVGYESKEVSVSRDDELVINLERNIVPGDEIIMSAMRRPVKSLRSPVSVESYSSAYVRNAPASDYYSVAGYKKGIDMTTSSITFKTISTRGFNGSGSARVNQMVDGMDNQAPGLNFFVGNFAGVPELDMDNIEILPGASSALYGPGGINGTVLITSKNPFQSQGLSVLLKQGVTNVDKTQRSGATSFRDFSIRYAKVIKERFAFKLNAQYISATDWLASDSTNYSRMGSVGKTIPGTRRTDPNYDGVNIYGDETKVDIQPFLAGALPAGHPLIESIIVSRTGYEEKHLIDPETKNIKLTGALHYKLNSQLEAILAGYWATGNTVYTGNNRYALENIMISQYKAELRSANWFLRSYTTQEDAGDAYSATLAGQYVNEGWKRSFDPANISGSWYPQFTGAYLTARGAGADKATALHMARAFADQGRPDGGSDGFKKILNQVKSIPIPKGARFLEKSQLWMSEGQYNFSSLVKFVDIIAGANWKKYILDSKGTLFIDTLDAITFNEVGAYAQVSKKLLKERLTLSFSGRYDKNEDFKGRFTPRATALIGLAENHNLRVSYQTAYRFPTTQQKYINLDVGDYSILGGLPWVMDFMKSKSNTIVELINGVPATTPYAYKEFKPESMTSYEVGYKALINRKLLIDAYGYWGSYRDFLTRNTLFRVNDGAIFSTVVNSPTKVKTYGFGLGMDYYITPMFSVFMNVYSDELKNVPANLMAYFNTPKYRVNAGVGHTGLGRNKAFGFNVVLHWQDNMFFEGDLANGPVDAFTTVDAQVNYKFEKIKTMVKLGGTNVMNKYYKNGFGNPEIGGLYYVSLGYNLFK